MSIRCVMRDGVLMTADEALVGNTRAYVTACLNLFEQEMKPEDVERVAQRVAAEMRAVIVRQQLLTEVMEACFTPEERQQLKDQGQ